MCAPAHGGAAHPRNPASLGHWGPALAGRQPARPRLPTTLLPLALGIGDGAEIQQPLAITVITGLLSSTLLTLVVIPAAYVQVAQATEKWR